MLNESRSQTRFEIDIYCCLQMVHILKKTMMVEMYYLLSFYYATMTRDNFDGYRELLFKYNAACNTIGSTKHLTRPFFEQTCENYELKLKSKNTQLKFSQRWRRFP